jgi:pilus assembly protein CpaC
VSVFASRGLKRATGQLALAVLIAAGSDGLAGKGQQPEQPAAPAQSIPSTLKRVLLTAGRSTVVMTDFDISRIAVTNPAVADAVVVQPREILIDGKSAGTVSLIIWGATQREQYDLVVDQGVPSLQRQLNALFPGEDIHVSASDEAVILSGQVSSNAVVLRSGEIAQASASKAKVINMLQLPGGSESQQVILQVRFAEVNRRALTELGASLFLTRPEASGLSSTQQFPAPSIDKGAPGAADDLVFSDFLNLFFFHRSSGVGAVIKALKTRGFFQSLAEPNLIAYNGQEASFLAGGEIPVPVVQGNNGSVTVQYKEFGIRLTFRPTIAGDVIRLKVRPEVSTLDFGNGITLSGFRIPALSTRRAETDVELRDGQSFVIAGLLDNLTQETSSEVPILSRLPIIGNFFKSKSDRTERTELMVLITPRLVQPLDPDEVPPLPTRPRRFLPAPTGDAGDEVDGGGTVDAPAKPAAQKAKP